MRSRTYQSDINQLEEQLAEEKQQLSDAIKRQQRTNANAEAVKQLSSEAEQTNLREKLEERDTILHRALQQIEDGFQKQL